MSFLQSRHVHIGLVLLLLVPAGCSVGATVTPAATAPPDLGKRAVSEHGMVAAGMPEASEAGVELLRQGGNAVDAAVGAAFALGVVEPMMSGIGAGGGLLVFRAADRQADYLDFYSMSGADIDTGVRSLRGNDRITARGVGIPGAVAGLLAAHERYGRLPRAAVLAPAIRLAADGYPASALLAREVEGDSMKLSRSAGARRIFLPDGHPIRAGDIVVQPELAATLRRIAAGGAPAFYSGPVADDIVGVLRADGSRLTADDFAGYTPRWKRPLCTDYRGHVVLSAPAPQSGMQVLEALNLLADVDLPAIGYPHRDSSAFRRLAGAMRVALVDRDAFVGDPDQVAVPMAGLTSRAFAQRRRPLAEAPQLADTLPAPDPWAADSLPAAAACRPYQPVGTARTARAVGANAAGDGALAETTHLSVVDGDGNAVSLTNTNGLAFGTGTWAAGAFFNSAMFNFSRDPNSPNAMAAHKVPASTIAPTLVLDDGRVRLVVGSPGSAAIPPAIIETIVYTLEYGMDPLQALRVPRLIPTSGRRLRLEQGFATDVLAAARRLGYLVETTPPIDMSFGGVHVIERVGNRWVGAADPRRNGEVRGY